MTPYALSQLAATIVAIIAITILLLQGAIDSHGGLEVLAYLVGFGVGGTFGPKIGGS